MDKHQTCIETTWSTLEIWLDHPSQQTTVVSKCSSSSHMFSLQETTWARHPVCPMVSILGGSSYFAEKSAEKVVKSWQKRTYLGGGWTNPSERYALQIGSFPQIGMNIKDYLSCHHLVTSYYNHWKSTCKMPSEIMRYQKLSNPA